MLSEENLFYRQKGEHFGSKIFSHGEISLHTTEISTSITTLKDSNVGGAWVGSHIFKHRYVYCYAPDTMYGNFQQKIKNRHELWSVSSVIFM